jgi:hypothetical protein
MKNIVICSDGTGNSSVKGRGTNVFKLFEAIDLNGHRTDPLLTPQVALYDDGVGTENFKPLKIFAGATGFGLSRNVDGFIRNWCAFMTRAILFLPGLVAALLRLVLSRYQNCGILDTEKLPTARNSNPRFGRLTESIAGATGPSFKLFVRRRNHKDKDIQQRYRVQMTSLFRSSVYGIR